MADNQSANMPNPFGLAIGYWLLVILSDKEPRLLLAGLQRILQQHGDRHGSNPAGDWGNCAGFRCDLVEVDIAGESKAFFPAGVFNASCAHIDNDSTFANVLFFYKAGLPHRRNKNFCGCADFYEIPATRVDDGNGSVASWSFGH